MAHFGRCKYCGQDLTSQVYKGKYGARMIVYCDNDKCEVQPCTNDTIPSFVIEELKCFAI